MKNMTIRPAHTLLAAALCLSACSQSPENLPSSSALPNDSDDSGITSAPIDKNGTYVSTSNTNVTAFKGDTFDIDVTLNNVATTEGGGISLRFDPSVVNVESITIDSNVWDFKNKEGAINNVQGFVSDILFSSYKGVSDNATIATIKFKATGIGSSKIHIEGSPANPFASNGEIIEVAYDIATVQVQ